MKSAALEERAERHTRKCYPFWPPSSPETHQTREVKDLTHEEPAGWKAMPHRTFHLFTPEMVGIVLANSPGLSYLALG